MKLDKYECRKTEPYLLLFLLVLRQVYVLNCYHTEKKTEGCSVPKDGPVGPDGKKLKPCCACPETKVPRDACIMEKVRTQ